MSDEITPNKEKKVEVKVQQADSVYGIGLVGAWMYFVGRAETPRQVVEGILKGFVWPAILVKALFEFLEVGKQSE